MVIQTQPIATVQDGMQPLGARRPEMATNHPAYERTLCRTQRHNGNGLTLFTSRLATTSDSEDRQLNDLVYLVLYQPGDTPNSAKK